MEFPAKQNNDNLSAIFFVTYVTRFAAPLVVVDVPSTRAGLNKGSAIFNLSDPNGFRNPVGNSYSS